MAFERLARLLRPPVEREVDDELAFHVEMRARELSEQGMDPRAARLAAERRFDDLSGTKRTLVRIASGRDRDQRRREWWGELHQDLGFAVRQMGKSPGFAAAAVFTLALGIGATTAIFSVLHAVVLQPLPFPAADRIHVVATTSQGSPGSTSAGNYVYVAERQRSFAPLAAVDFRRFNLTEGDAPERVLGAGVSFGFFEVFGVAPARGRVFTAEEDAPGPDRVAVLGHGLWTRRFGGDPQAIGRTALFSGVPREIIGVMPEGFHSTEGEELWVPIAFTPERRAMHDEHYLVLYGRLRDGVGLAQARSDLTRVAKDLSRDTPRDNPDRGATAWPLIEEVVGPYPQRLAVLLGATGLVLLIACANVANLLLGRGALRARELAVRAALGAGRGRIVRQLLTESLALGFVAALAGVLVAEAGRRLILGFAPPGVPRLEGARIDLLALGFAVALGALASLMFGLAPALTASRADLRQGLLEGGRASTGGRDRARRALVAAEIALALTLLVGAGLLVRTGMNLTRASVGFDPENVLTARMGLPREGYESHEKAARAFEAILDNLRANPEVAQAAFVSKLPLTPGRSTNGLIPDDRPFDIKSTIDTDLQIVTPGYLEAMRIPLREGRTLTAADRRGAPKVMVINEDLARQAFPSGGALGRRIACCEPGPGGRDTPDWKEVVGVVANVAPSAPGAPPRPQFYLPMDQVPAEAWDWTGRTLGLVARSAQSPAALTDKVRAAVRSVDPTVPVYDVRTMLERRRAATAQERFGASLLTALGLVGLVLAGVGIYGVVSLFVSQRGREIAVRLALGASVRDVIRLVVRQGMSPVLLGLAFGALGAFAAGRALEAMLFGVGAVDPATLLAVGLVLFAVAVLACLLPARRAARVEPARALAEG